MAAISVAFDEVSLNCLSFHEAVIANLEFTSSVFAPPGWHPRLPGPVLVQHL